MYRFIFILFFIGLSSVKPVNGQNIEGKVIDSRTKEALPFVNIVYSSSNYGTTTNIDGNFSIKTDKFVNKLIISYIGYNSDTVLFSSESSKNLIIELQPKMYSIDEAVILPGINPADVIINKVIDNRDLNNPEKIQSFSCNAYSKMIFTLGRDSLNMPDSVKYIKSRLEQKMEKHHLLLIETLSEKNYLYPGKYNEKVVASKTSGINDPIFSLVASQIQSFSFYNEYFAIFDKMYVNPISKNSTKRYLFILEDTLFNEKGDSVFVISYRPKKGKNFDGLKGFLHINTNKYAIQSVVAEPLEKEQGMVIGIQQNYEYIDNKQWFPKELITNITFVDALDSKDKNDYNLIAKSRSYISDINLKPDLNTRDFNNIELKIENDAVDKSSEYWESNRNSPLSDIETETYRVIDSISKAENLDRTLMAFEALMNGNIPYGYVNLPINKIIDYNNFEGFRLGLGAMTNNKVSKYFSVGGYLAYGFKDKEFKYGGDLILNLHKDSECKIHFTYSNDLQENAGYSFFEKVDLSSSEIYRKYLIANMDIVENYGASFSILSFNYLRAKIFMNQSYIKSTDGYSFGPSLFNSTSQFSFNEIGIQLRYAYNEKYIQTLKAKYPIKTNYPILCVNITQGTNLFDGEFEYTKYEAKITKQFNTKAFGKSKITLVGGLADGDIPLSKLYNGHGSYESYSLEAENSFGTMRMGEFYSDRFFSVYFKHDFGSLLFKSKKFSPKIAIVHNYGIGEFTNKDKHYTTSPIKSIDKGFYEGGILVNNILNQSLIGIGAGVFYRYGPYSFVKTADNFAYKISFTFVL